MGKRSISSTKTGRFMNPTDQARKEARRRELKKNKKQRQIVRQAVLKGKDPKHLITEMEVLDKMEFDPNNPPPYNVKVIQDKRKKLKETWTKIFKLYEREDPKQATELKQMEVEYEKRRSQLVAIYESIKQAERVKLEDIPLPDTPMGFMMPVIIAPGEIPLPTAQTQAVISAPPAINQSTSVQKGILKTKVDLKRDPPGPPPGPPPPLTEFECDDDEKELDKPKKIRFAEDTISTQSKDNVSSSSISITKSTTASQSNFQSNRPSLSVFPTTIDAHRVAPPPPPPPSSIVQQSRNIPQTLPPPLTIPSAASHQNIYSALPTRSTIPAQKTIQIDDKPSLIIEAKPVLRNKMAELTRFVPTSLVIKRDQKNTSSKIDDRYSYAQQHSNSTLQQYTAISASKENKEQKPSTDSAYEAFMKEINKFL